MYKLTLSLLTIYMALSSGCTNVSHSSSSVPPAQETSSTDQGSYDYSHDLSPKRKYVVVIMADYRQYQGDDLPNVSKVGTDIGRQIALNNNALQITLNDIATAIFEENNDKSIEKVKYYDNKASELQDFFDENPIALLKRELVNNDMFVVLDEDAAKEQGSLDPRYVVSMNIHRAKTGNMVNAKCYLNLIDKRTGRIVASSRGSGVKLEESIIKASDELKKNLL